jgi:hypothetical protein
MGLGGVAISQSRKQRMAAAKKAGRPRLQKDDIPGVLLVTRTIFFGACAQDLASQSLASQRCEYVISDVCRSCTGATFKCFPLRLMLRRFVQYKAGMGLGGVDIRSAENI